MPGTSLLICFLPFLSGPEWKAGRPETQPDQVKVAAVQITGYVKGFERKPGYDPVAPLLPYIARANGDGAQLVVFPEYHLGQISIPGPETKRISEAAKRHRIYVIVGGWERLDGDAFANAALLFDRKGHIQGKYYKTHAAVDKFEGSPAFSRPPSGRDRKWFVKNDPEWIMEKGKDLPVFDLDFGRIGILTCYDGWFPESFRVLSLKGAEIIVWINGRGGHIQDFMVKAAMFQNHVAMVCTNQAYGAGTMIADWPSRIKAYCPEAKEQYITATINLKALRLTRKRSRNFQQRRPDLYEAILSKPPIWKYYEAGER